MRKILFPLDIIAATAVGIIGAAIVLVTPRRKTADRNLVVIMPCSFDAVLAKFGVEIVSRYRDESAGGLFKNVWMYAYPMAETRKTFHCPEKVYGVTFHFVDRHPFFRLLYASGAAALCIEIAWRVKRSGITVVRARDPFFCGLVAWIVRLITGVRFVISMHTDYEHLFNTDPRHIPHIPGGKRMMFAMADFTFRRAERILPIRDSIGHWPRRLGVSDSKVEVIPHGTDLSAFLRPVEPVRKKYGVAEDRPMIFTCGRITVDNYFHHILEMAAIVVERFPEAVFCVAGNGWDLERLREKTASSPLAENVLWLGGVVNSDCQELWKACDVALLMKGGYSLIEAAASGKPVVSYDIEWHYELIENGKSGWLVKPEAADGAQAVIDALSLPEAERSRIAAESRKRAFERHSLEEASKVKKRIFEDVIAELGI